MTNITLPIIHLNGTSAEDLLKGNLAASDACSDAINAIGLAEFNGRDYYPVPGAWDKAVAERTAHVQAIRAAKDYFMAIAMHADTVISEKQARQRERATS